MQISEDMHKHQRHELPLVFYELAKIDVHYGEPYAICEHDLDDDVDEEIWCDVMPDAIGYDHLVSMCDLEELNGSQLETKGDP
ncbi:hypothetical protein GOP47_0015368 [Adiantum capillus-veneris]|uniref:Uncharacterized protein n=1 Tax=Adiantum capillus-veneris TaxID=13818 RepID=A0A9D4ZCK9_ADICA|nr:hypothetical protein GOP47_0015368 [Adiantum capillus-veneris]